MYRGTTPTITINCDIHSLKFMIITSSDNVCENTILKISNGGGSTGLNT